MGFNKRFFNKKNIIYNIDNIMDYLNVDAAYIKDEFSLDIYRMYIEGKNKEEIISYINKKKDDNIR